MRRNPSNANIPFADVLVPVNMRSERRLGIVGVNHAHVFDAQNAVGLSATVSCRPAAVETSYPAASRWQVSRQKPMGRSVILRGVIANRVQLFEAAADLRAGADRIFEQQHQLPNWRPCAAAATPSMKVQNALLERLAFVIAGMRDKVLGADRDGAHPARRETPGSTATRTVRSADARLIR